MTELVIDELNYQIDVVYLNKMIEFKIKTRAKSIPNLKTTLSTLSDPIQIEELNKIIDSYDCLDRYKEEVKPIIDKWNKYPRTDMYESLITLQLKKFIEVASTYYPIKILHENLMYVISCPCCESPLNKGKCGECGYEITQTAFPTNGSKSCYEKEINFEKEVNKFRGRISKNITPIIDIVKKECVDKGIDEKTLSKEAIRSILYKLDPKKCYGYVNIIHHKLTGEPLPDIDQYFDKVILRYKLYNAVFMDKDWMKKNIGVVKTRNNSLRIHVILLAFLQMEGCKCKRMDFNLLKTRNTIVEHNQTMSKICMELQKRHPDMNWKFTPL